MSRPSSQHRLSTGSNAAAIPIRNSYSRSHSHTVSLGSSNPHNRIGRRKSSTFSPAANPAAITAATVESAVADGSAAVKRRSSVSKAALASLNDGPHLPASVAAPNHAAPSDAALSSSSAIVDGPSLSSFQAVEKMKPKMRRASDGTRLTKKERAASGNMKCEHCGKAYKHGSCLNKHLWEHTPQWQVTSKLLISKHQQVQLLEAASVLVQMNTENSVTNDSDNSSSPAASGSEDHDDDLSSTETTPPPQGDSAFRDSKRDSNNSSLHSRSYQSVFSSGSAPTGGDGFSHFRQWSTSSYSRPFTADSSIAENYQDEDPADLAAAVGLLSCSYGTPKSGPISMGGDIPPVPPLPAKYAHVSSPNRGQGDVNMRGDHESDDDEVYPQNHYQHHDDEEGVFGKMDA